MVSTVAWLIGSFSSPGLANQEGATLIGHVTFSGKIPPPMEISVTENMEFCGETVSIQPLVINTDTLGVQSAVVSVEGTMEQGGEKGGIAESHLIIANLQCQFNPRVVAAQQGDVLELRNLDAILHQTHLKRDKRTKMNVSQLPAGHHVQKSLKKPGVYHLNCDKHSFMDAYLLVFNHPYFSITDADGTFRITGLPPGKQIIKVWHETLKILEKEVLLPDHGLVTLDFAYH